MVDPVSLGVASLAATAGSTGISMFGASAKADAESAASNYKAAVARNNAIIAERNAQSVTQAGSVAAQTNDMKTNSKMGQALAGQSASGLDVGSGSAVQVRQSIADIGHLDTLTIVNNALKQATGIRAQGANYTAEANLDTMAAENAQTAGGINVASSLLGGATSFSDRWYKFDRAGVFN